MNWTPDDNYNGNRSGWNDGNPNGYRIDNAVIAHPASGRPIIHGFLRLVLAIMLLAGVIAAYNTVRVFHSYTRQSHYSRRSANKTRRFPNSSNPR